MMLPGRTCQSEPGTGREGTGGGVLAELIHLGESATHPEVQRGYRQECNNCLFRAEIGDLFMSKCAIPTA
jgi:hypothetical protein